MALTSLRQRACAPPDWGRCFCRRQHRASRCAPLPPPAGFQFLAAVKLLPEQHKGPAGPEADAAAGQLATSLGAFLRTCPGLNKTTIGELLGEPDAFYLQASRRRGWLGPFDRFIASLGGCSASLLSWCAVFRS